MTERSAPGKVILFGEHAVVYGQPALAVPVEGARVRVIVEDLPDEPAGWARIDAPAVGTHSWLHEMSETDPLAAVVRASLAAGARRPGAGLRLRLESDLPVGAGMGSSAAVSVAVLRAVSAHLGLELDPARQSALAFEIEKLQHGTPSGIDNAVIAYGRPLFFTPGRPPEFLQVRRPFTLMIGDSGDRVPTREVVAAVREQRASDPEGVGRVLAEIGSLAAEARRHIESGAVAALGPLMDRNQALLKALGVSGKGLEALIRAAKRAGALGAKLSGGGRGGVMIALVEPAALQAVERALREAGAIQTIPSEVRA